MIPAEYIVYVIDDDVRVCEAMRELFASLGLPSVTFGSVAEYVAYPKPDLPACLILDVELPDISGLDFQRQLGDAYHPPIVFVTGHADIPSSVRAIKAGAVDFLAKPFSQPDLLAAVNAAIARSILRAFTGRAWAGNCRCFDLRHARWSARHVAE